MGENLGNALFITVLGMGLVFVIIVLLWGLMAAIVAVLPEKETVEEEAAQAPAALEAAQEPALAATDVALKQRAAAAAVAVALAVGSGRQANPLLTADGASLTAWQTVNRANRIKSKQQRGLGR